MGPKIIYHPKYHKFVSLNVGEEKFMYDRMWKLSFGVNMTVE